jgi:hypothetical protein
MDSTSTGQAHCLRCGRTIYAAASVRAKYGPGCRARIRREAVAAVGEDFKAEQFAKALELISDGGLVPHAHAGVYRAVSSRGDVTYLAHSHGCTCPAGLRSRSACYHQAAARVLEATRTALATAA